MKIGIQSQIKETLGDQWDLPDGAGKERAPTTERKALGMFRLVRYAVNQVFPKTHQ